MPYAPVSHWPMPNPPRCGAARSGTSDHMSNNFIFVLLTQMSDLVLRRTNKMLEAASEDAGSTLDVRCGVCTSVVEVEGESGIPKGVLRYWETLLTSDECVPHPIVHYNPLLYVITPYCTSINVQGTHAQGVGTVMGQLAMKQSLIKHGCCHRFVLQTLLLSLVVMALVCVWGTRSYSSRIGSGSTIYPKCSQY